MDLTFINNDNTVFNCRVGLIINNNNKYLIQNYGNSGIYSLIGGRIKLGENSIETAIRECFEETGIKIKPEELNFITIVENFFEHQSKNYHELLFLYEVNNKRLKKIKNHLCLDDSNNSNYWYTIDQLKKLNLKPTVLFKVFNGNIRIPLIHSDKK